MHFPVFLGCTATVIFGLGHDPEHEEDARKEDSCPCIASDEIDAAPRPSTSVIAIVIGHGLPSIWDDEVVRANAGVASEWTLHDAMHPCQCMTTRAHVEWIITSPGSAHNHLNGWKVMYLFMWHVP